MSKGSRFQKIILCAAIAFGASASAQGSNPADLNSKFKSAVDLDEAGRFKEAAALLEEILPEVPNSFEVHELLGQVYASMSFEGRAEEQLRKAVELKPDSGPARTNLAALLLRSGKSESAGDQFRKALELEPADFDANHNLGEFYIETGKTADAIPWLEKAERIRPSAYDNGFDLCQAEFLTGHVADARLIAHALLKVRDTGELHNLLGQIEESDGKYVEAASQFQAAAQMDPSEDNLFDWGSELLLHRTYDPAIEVFRHASEQYSNSPRLLIGLGMALYSRGKYDEAIKALLTAADMRPTDPRCYFFLSRAYDSSPSQAEDVIQRFRRYSELEPDNALAQYYLAMSLWKGKRAEDATVDLSKVESLMKKAIELDRNLAEAHLQLGNLYADQHEYARSIPEYTRALALNPNLSDAHYRLGQDFVHTGQKELAEKEFGTYQKLRAQHLADVDKERAEVQQFVYAEKAPDSTKR